MLHPPYDLYKSKKIYDLFLRIYFEGPIRNKEITDREYSNKHNISHKMFFLKEMGIINEQPKGNSIYYTINKKILKQKIPNFKPNKKVWLEPKCFLDWGVKK